ncbi:MAG: hypothetical protein JWM62_2174 [Frankiales bacterium]|nr:hypothetical protein [Frankiales bacterium]
MTVADCAAARTSSPEVLFPYTGADGAEAETTLGYDPAFLGTLLSSACPS